VLRELERKVVLSVLDRKWREHLYEMDYLQEGIQLRSYGQRDPLVEYQREGFTMFQTMMDAIKEESVAFLFNLEVQVTQVSPDADAEAEEAVTGAAAAAEAEAEAATAAAAVGSQAADGERAVAAASSDRSSAADDVELAPVGGVEVVAPGLQTARRPSRLEYSAPTIDGAAGAGSELVNTGSPNGATGDGQPLMYEGTPRNAKCPCGSGKTYKRCHGDPHHAA
jgi:preprotein translocase subunit SecA